MTTPLFGAYFQCYKNPFATYKVLESFRKFYPSCSIVLCSDNGYDYTKMAEYFNCIYYHRAKNMWLIYEDCAEIDKGANGNHIPWAKELLQHMKTVFSLVKEDYILWLEDDLGINHMLLDPFSNDINGFNPNKFTEDIKKALSIHYPHIDPFSTYTWSGGGGSIFNKHTMLDCLNNETIINDILIHWRGYNLTSNIVCDYLLSLLVLLNKGTIGPLNGVRDGPRDYIDMSITIQHQYKHYYGHDMPNELSYLVNK